MATTAIRFSARCHVLDQPDSKHPYSLKRGMRLDLPAGFAIDGIPVYYISVVEDCATDIAPKQAGEATIRMLVADKTTKQEFLPGRSFQLTFGGQYTLADCVVTSEPEEVLE